MHTDSTKLTDTAKLLKECDAGTKMAISSINEILEKVENPKLNEILTLSRNAHEQLEAEVHSLLNYHEAILLLLSLLLMAVIWELNL